MARRVARTASRVSAQATRALPTAISTICQPGVPPAVAGSTGGGVTGVPALPPGGGSTTARAAGAPARNTMAAATRAMADQRMREMAVCFLLAALMRPGGRCRSAIRACIRSWVMIGFMALSSVALGCLSRGCG